MPEKDRVFYTEYQKHKVNHEHKNHTVKKKLKKKKNNNQPSFF